MKNYQKFFNLNLVLRIRRIYQQLLLSWLIAVLIVACHHSPGSETASTADCRTINHVVGETCVPSNPERLIALGDPTMADAIALGVKPVGSILYFDQTPPYLEGKLDGIEPLGKIAGQPNLEKTLSLNPDVIIGVEDSSESVYGQLSQIAPTVLGSWKGYPSWKDHFNFVAEVLGKTEEAEQIWKQYEQRIQQLRAALGNRYQDIEVSFVHICCGPINIDFKNSFNGMILDDVGLSRPPAQDVVIEGGIGSISEERLMDIDGDILFIAVDGDESTEILEQLQQKPLWNQLKAVQQGRVYPVSYPAWRGGNPLAANAVIDDLFNYLVNSGQPT